MTGTPAGRRRAASSASTRISTPRPAARWRCNCSRQALCVSTARSKLALAAAISCSCTRPGGAAVAGRPVRATQAGVRQAHEGAEHDDGQGQQHGDPGQAMEMAVRAFMAASVCRVGSFHQFARGLCARRRDRSPARSAARGSRSGRPGRPAPRRRVAACGSAAAARASGAHRHQARGSAVRLGQLAEPEHVDAIGLAALAEPDAVQRVERARRRPAPQSAGGHDHDAPAVRSGCQAKALPSACTQFQRGRGHAAAAAARRSCVALRRRPAGEAQRRRRRRRS